jgi:hypothetical protein
VQVSGVSWEGLLELAEPDHGLWTFHQPLSGLGAKIGCRMTVVRLSCGDLLLHSPIRLTSELRSRLDELGPVRHVLAPNLDHYLFVRDYRVPYPQAVFYAAPGVQPKLPGFSFDVLLEHPRTVTAWTETLEQAYFRSSNELQELVLFHRASRTLIAADLAFNVQSTSGLLSQVMLRLNDSYKTFGPSRVCRSHLKLPQLARADLDAILGLAPARLVISHGEILLEGAAGALAGAYAWLPGQQRAR